MHVLHVISGLWKHTGGPAESTPGLCTALVQAGCEVTLATLDGPMAETVWTSQAAGVNVRLFRPNWRHTIYYSWEMARGLPTLARRVDIVHVHGLWEHPMWLGCRLARRFGKPLVITPRGSLEPVRLKKSRWKKTLVSSLIDNRNLRAADCLHATADSELQSFRKYGLNNPVAVIPNAVNLSAFSETSTGREITNRFPACQGKRILLFMSRINPIKGLLDLAKAWGEVAFDYPDWHLLVVGPDERGHLAEVQKAFYRSGAAPKTTFAGALYGPDRTAAFAAAELFILPTLNENFGVVIAEAIGFGLPVITTHGAPWSGIEEHRCGWWVPVGKAGLVGALRKALGLSQDELAEIGQRGKLWVQQTFTWDAVAREMIAVYRWLLTQSSQPECVRLDGVGAGIFEFDGG